VVCSTAVRAPPPLAAVVLLVTSPQADHIFDSWACRPSSPGSWKASSIWWRVDCRTVSDAVVACSAWARLSMKASRIRMTVSPSTPWPMPELVEKTAGTVEAEIDLRSTRCRE
jgi:hypothetical protein